ncbi:YsgD/CorL family protein [Escherichia coli]
MTLRGHSPWTPSRYWLTILSSRSTPKAIPFC